MRVVEGATVDHVVKAQDYRLGEIVVWCESETRDESDAVDKDVEDVDACSNCVDAGGDRIPDELVDDEEDDDVDDG